MAKATSTPAPDPVTFSLRIAYTKKGAGIQSSQADVYDPTDLDHAVTTYKNFVAENPGVTIAVVTLQYQKQVGPARP